MTAAEEEREWKTNLNQQLQWLKWEGNRTIQVEKAWLLTWNATQMIPVKGNSLCQVTSTSTRHEFMFLLAIRLCNRLPVLLKDLSSIYTLISFDPFQNQFFFFSLSFRPQDSYYKLLSLYSHFNLPAHNKKTMFSRRFLRVLTVVNMLSIKSTSYF